MTFEENPFHVLQGSIYDTKVTIIERADDLSFADPDREEIIKRARDILLNPRKRIAAKMLWFDTVESFIDAIKPLDKFSIALGTNNFEETEEIFYADTRCGD